MKLNPTSPSSFAAFSLLLTGTAPAAFITHVLPGNSDFDGWDDLTATNPQVAGASPAFPTIGTVTSPWPEAIISHMPGSGDATFNKSAGGGYPASANIYTGFATGGSFVITDTSPVTDLETVIVQLDIGQGSGDFLAGDPTLTINGGEVIPLFASGVTGTGPRPGFAAPIEVGSLAYQWDLRGVGPITAFEIAFTTDGTSSTIWGARLDQGDRFTAVPVPEPSSALFLSLAGLGLLRRKRA